MTASAATNISLIFNTTYGSTIAEAGEQDVYTFTGTGGQRLYYDALDFGFDQVFVRLVNPSGLTVHITDVNSDQNVGPFILTEPGPYSLVVYASADLTADYQFRLLDVTAAPALTVGTILTNQLGQRIETDIFQFNGTAGQRVNLDSVQVNGAASQANWSLLSPAHVALTFPGSITTTALTADLGTVTLPFTGPYYLVIVGNVSNAVPLIYRVLLTDVSEAPVATSGLDVQRSGTILAGLTHTINFTAPAGLPVYFDSLDRGGNTLLVEVKDPSSNLVFSISQTNDAGPFILPRSGTYTLQVRGNSPSATGLFLFRLLDLSSVPVVALNTTISNNLTSAYKTDVYRLAGAAGQRLYYDAIDNDSDLVNVRLQNPDGTFVVNQNSDLDRGPFTLPMAGTYYLFLESSLVASVDYQFQLFDLASQPALPLDVDLTGSLDPGRGVKIYHLAGTAGQQLYFDGKGTNPAASWFWSGPNDAAGGSATINNDFEVTLTNAGTYVLVLSGSSAVPVNYTNRVVTFGFETIALVVGFMVSNTIAEPGEQDVYTFTGTTGQRLFYDALDGDNDPINVRLIDPAGAIVFLINGNSDTDRSPFTLTQTGTYQLVIDASGATTGDYSFRLLDVAVQPVLPLDTPTTNAVAAYEAVLHRFEGTAGQRLFFDALSTSVNGSWNLYGPNDETVLTGNPNGNYDVRLAASGRYVLAMFGGGATNQNHAFQIITLNDNPNVAANAAPELGFIGAKVIGEGVRLTFTATATDLNPGDTNRFSLDSGAGAPPTATIHPTTGVFEWIPPITGFSYPTAVTIRVTDNGVPALSAAQTFNITVVVGPVGPVMIGVTRTGSTATVVWSSTPAKIYRLQYKHLVDDPAWIDVSPGVDVTATGSTTSQMDPGIGTDDQRYYQVVLLNP